MDHVPQRFFEIMLWFLRGATMTYMTMAIGSNAILLAAALMATAVILLAFHKRILGALGVKSRKRRLVPKRRPDTKRLDIASSITDEV